MNKPFYLILITLTSLSLFGCDPPYESNPKNIFQDQLPKYKTYSLNNRSIHYAEIGQNSAGVVIFIHGTPGSWQAFAHYLADKDLSQSLKMIAVDRPGFGKSDYGKLVPSLSEQASLLLPLLEAYDPGCGIILVGHSLGAPVAVRMAMAFPEKVSALILIAPSLDPDLEAPKWFNRLAELSAISWLVPSELMYANQEVMVLQDELTQMLPFWDLLDLPIIVIQGNKDNLVDPANADFVEQKIRTKLKVVRVDNGGHFILWKQPELIKSELIELVEHQRNNIKYRKNCNEKTFISSTIH